MMKGRCRVGRMRDAAAQRIDAVPEGRGAEWVPTRHWQSPLPLRDALAAATAPPGEAVEVYVNEGRWVVSCPDCGGAQLACRSDPRFLCNECANVVIGGLWRPVVWPEDVLGIETALEKRPLVHTRNWLPGETAAQLLAEQHAREA